MAPLPQMDPDEALLSPQIIITKNTSFSAAKKEADSIFDSLINEALYLPGDHGIDHKDINNDWISPELIKQGKAFFNRNYWSCVFTVLVTELIQYPIQRITSFVLRNETYNSPQYGYKRGVATFHHILRWFDYDITDKMSKSSQDIYKIRKLHQAALIKLGKLPPSPPNTPINDRLHILDAIRKDMKSVEIPHFLPLIMTRNPTVPMSQFDMVIVHGVFYLLLDTAPERVGVYDQEGYEAYIHYIAVIGKYLGIEDRFNLPLISDPRVRKLVSKRLWNEVLTPCYKSFDDIEFMNLSYFGENGFILNPFALATHIIVNNILGLGPSEYIYEHLNVFYRFIYKFVLFAIWGNSICIIRIFMNFLASFLIWFGSLLAGDFKKSGNCSFSGNGGGGGVCPISSGKINKPSIKESEQCLTI